MRALIESIHGSRIIEGPIEEIINRDINLIGESE